MQPPADNRTVVLVVQHERMLEQLVQNFPATTYLLLYASGAEEALALCETRTLDLIVTPAGPAHAGLIAAMRAVERSESLFIGVTEEAELAPRETWSELGVDVLVSEVAPEAAVEAIRELVHDRRQRPRAAVDFPVTLNVSWMGTVRSLSDDAFLVQTPLALQVGEEVTAEIQWTDAAPISFKAHVGKLEPSDSPEVTAAVLFLDEAETEAREYFAQLVRKLIELDHFVQRHGGEGPPTVAGPAAWKLARHAEHVIRSTQELGVATASAEDASGSRELLLEGRFQVGPQVARWGVGDLFTATHRLLGHDVWLKILRTKLRHDDLARKRLEQEARVISMVVNTLPTAAVALVTDFGDDGLGGLYYAMEPLAGESLQRALEREERFALRDVVVLGLHLAATLGAAHRLKTGHFDLCPDQVFLHRTPGGRLQPKLVNFAGAAPLGTPISVYFQGESCFAPERRSRTPAPAVDIFALGRVLERMVDAAPAAPDETEPEAAARALLRDALAHATASRTTDRFESMSALAGALEAVLASLPSAVGEPATARFVDPPGRPSAEPAPGARPAGLPRTYTVPWPRALRRPVQLEPGPAVAETLAAPLPAPSSAVAETLAAPLPAPSSAVAETLAAPLPAPEPEPPPEPAWSVGVAATLFSVPEAAAATPAPEPAAVPLPTAEAAPRRRAGLPVVLIIVAVAGLAAAGLLWYLQSSGSPSSPPRRPRTYVAVAPDAAPPLPDAARALADARPAPTARDAETPPVDARAADAAVAADASAPADAANRPLTAAQQRIAGLLQQARAALGSGKVAEARRAIRSAQNVKDSAEANDLLAETYERDGDSSTALYYARQAVALDAHEPAFTLRLGRLLLRSKRRGEACRLARAVLKRQPASAAARALETEACDAGSRP